MTASSFASDSASSRRAFLRSALWSSAVTIAGSTLLRADDRLTGDNERYTAVAKALDESVREGAFPGCTAAFGNSQLILWQGAFGFLSLQRDQPVKLSTRYDLASLTKIVGTSSVAARLIADGKLSLDDPVVKWVPEFGESGADDTAIAQRKSIAVRQLLTHTSGLPGWLSIYKSAKSYREVIAAVVSTQLEKPPGEKYLYSDLGLMLLGELLSRAGKAPLAELERRLIFEPLGMTSTLRNPPEAMRPSIAPTERIGDTDQFWQGVVHDENSRAGDGFTGHAGLFSDVADLAIFCQAWLQAVRDEKSIFDSRIARQFVSDQKVPGDTRRALGWQLFARGGSGGSLLDDSAFGHTGFTGTSLWLDPTRDLFLILLGNRVHPTRSNNRHLAARRKFADAVVRAVDAA